MPTKKVSTKKSNATPKEIIAKYDCLRIHVKILTVLSGLILVSVIALMIILINCDDFNKKPVKEVKNTSTVEVVEGETEEAEE